MRAQSLAVHSLTLALTTFWLAGCLDREGLEVDPPIGGASGSGGMQGGGGRMNGSGGRDGSGGSGGLPGTGGRGTGGSIVCGAVCTIACQYGNVTDANGCPTCSCKPPPVCPAIGCGNMCPGGYAKDPATGCPSCKCNPVCQPLPCSACPYGSYPDANGCATCMCKPAPTSSCTPEECGTPPPSGGAAIICASTSAGPSAGGSAPVPPGGTGIAAMNAVCRRNAAGKCSWTVGGSCCTGVACDIYCPYGNLIDGNGCATCGCNPPPVCSTASCGPVPTTPVVCDGSTGAGGAVGSPGAQPSQPIDVPVRAPLVCQQNGVGACTWQPIPGCRFCGQQPACRLACPNGFRTDPSGCQLCECNPTPMAACSQHGDYTACSSNMACTWLAPGCGDPALAAAGCYPRDSIGCTSDNDCDSGHQCLKRIINPCGGGATGGGASDIAICAACGQGITICQ